MTTGNDTTFRGDWAEAPLGDPAEATMYIRISVGDTDYWLAYDGEHFYIVNENDVPESAKNP